MATAYHISTLLLGAPGVRELFFVERPVFEIKPIVIFKKRFSFLDLFDDASLRTVLALPTHQHGVPEPRAI